MELFEPNGWFSGRPGVSTLVEDYQVPVEP